MMKKVVNQLNKILFTFTLINLIFVGNLFSQKEIKKEYIPNYYNLGKSISIEIRYIFYDSLKIEKITTNVTDKTIMKLETYKYIKDSLVKNGLSTEYTKSKKVFDGNYKNGKLDGRCFYYFMSGQIYAILNYNGGLLNGNYIQFYENGNPKETGKYKNGVPYGNWSYYYANGYLQAIGEYSTEKGVDSLKYNFFNDSCITRHIYTGLKSVNSYCGFGLHYIKIGLWKFYNCDGRLIKEVIFKEKF